MSIDVARAYDGDFIAFTLTFADGSTQRLLKKPTADDPNGDRYLARALATIRMNADTHVQARSKAFV